MDRRKPKDVLFYALQCAKSDRLSFIDAWASMPDAPEIAEAKKDIAVFSRLQVALFGTTRSAFDTAFDAMEPVTFARIKALVAENPSLPAVGDTMETGIAEDTDITLKGTRNA